MSDEEHNPAMVPFKYGEFYDVPRLIVLKYKGHLFMLGSYFNEEEDEYDDFYRIILLPSSIEETLSNSWEILFQDVGAKMIGRVPVKNVIFDPTKRKALNPHFLDDCMEKG